MYFSIDIRDSFSNYDPLDNNMRVINQLQRSALRRALQQIFIDGTLVIYSKLGTSISEEEKFNIYPIPAADLLNIIPSTDLSKELIEIRDLKGKIVFQKK